MCSRCGAEAEEFVEDTKRMREYLEAPFISAINELFVAADKDDSGMLDIFEVTADGYLVRTLIENRSPNESAGSIPPWRADPSSTSSSSLAPWREPMPKKQRITE